MAHLRSLAFAGTLALAACLQVAAAARPTVVEVIVHSQALEGNLIGDTPDRAVSIYLPPGYDEAVDTRYPVLYLLHGFSLTHTFWFDRALGWTADDLIGSGTIQPMIIVSPDANNAFAGSYYLDSPVTGHWETFITHDLVDYVDAHYRTLAKPEGRAIAGHSMGGYGTLVLALKHPGTYSVVYAMTPGCIDFALPQVGPYKSPRAFAIALQYLAAGVVPKSGIAASILAKAAAITPNPDNPPSYVDLPYKLVDGKPVRIDSVWAQWTAHTPMAMLDRYGPNLLLYRGIAFDVGLRDNDPDNLTGARALDRALTSAGIPHQYEEYDGDHVSKIPERMGTVVLPFVSDHLNPPRTASEAH